MKKEYKGVITLSGKKYNVEVINGECFVEGKHVNDFMKTITFEEMIQLAVVGKAVTEDEIITREMKAKRKSHENYKKRSPQKMLDEFHQSKNN